MYTYTTRQHSSLFYTLIYMNVCACAMCAHRLAHPLKRHTFSPKNRVATYHIWLSVAAFNLQSVCCNFAVLAFRFVARHYYICHIHANTKWHKKKTYKHMHNTTCLTMSNRISHYNNLNFITCDTNFNQLQFKLFQLCSCVSVNVNRWHHFAGSTLAQMFVCVCVCVYVCIWRMPLATL